ncbi:MAG: hypothetical protein CFE33_13025 [Pseudorhodobacter sp. PARRP1]|nr:MAG: hypothetical protein CFE33_13025 [Pseudorhodobacter sp. PARRP1]
MDDHLGDLAIRRQVEMVHIPRIFVEVVAQHHRAAIRQLDQQIAALLLVSHNAAAREVQRDAIARADLNEVALAVACDTAMLRTARNIADSEINRFYHLTTPPQKTRALVPSVLFAPLSGADYENRYRGFDTISSA